MNFAYKSIAEKALQNINRVDLDPGHLVALMRMEYGVLDDLPAVVFTDYAHTIAHCIDTGEGGLMDQLAASFAIPTRKETQRTA